MLADRLGYRRLTASILSTRPSDPSSLAFIAHLADACPSITFGTGVLSLANYHPAMAAAQLAMVDHLVQGRLILGMGAGFPVTREPSGLGTDRYRKSQEALEHMLRIWSEEPPPARGEFYRTTTDRSLLRPNGVGDAVRPMQRPHPPIAITSIRPTEANPTREPGYR